MEETTNCLKLKDLAEALYGIVGKHAEPEDVLHAMLKQHRGDLSNTIKKDLQALGVTWERTATTCLRWCLN